MYKPIAESCLRNQQPIADVLTKLFADSRHVLEIGSGTGQHAVYCAERLPHLIWQPTELAENLEGIEAWIHDSGLANVRTPIELDAHKGDWSFSEIYDAAFTANTVHYVGWSIVDAMFRGLSQYLAEGAVLAIYGAFNRNGRYTSEGNQGLDQWLRQRDPDSGLKDIEEVRELAESHGLVFDEEIAMPANNLILVFTRQT